MPDNKSLINGTESGSGRFESDSQKIVRKHLEDKDHVISDEEIRNVRVGMTPSPNEEHQLDEIIQKIEAEAETKEAEAETKEAEPETENDNKQKPADKPVTPWDTIDH